MIADKKLLHKHCNRMLKELEEVRGGIMDIKNTGRVEPGKSAMVMDHLDIITGSLAILIIISRGKKELLPPCCLS